jgi:hypothetical protein
VRARPARRPEPRRGRRHPGTGAASGSSLITVVPPTLAALAGAPGRPWDPPLVRSAYETQQGNDKRRRVLVPRSELVRTDAQQPQTGAHEDGLRDLLEGELDRLASELERTRSDVETWRAKAEQSALQAARHEADHKAAERIITDLERQRDRLADQPQAMLADARRPWWRRWMAS